MAETTPEKCPVCSAEGEALTPCAGCVFEDRSEALRARCRLDAYRRSAGDNAYMHEGCRVCPNCARQFGAQPDKCPLQIFYHGFVGVVARSDRRQGVRQIEEAIDFWRDCLKERGFPEHVEGFWRRMVDWLVYEVRRR